MGLSVGGVWGGGEAVDGGAEVGVGGGGGDSAVLPGAEEV